MNPARVNPRTLLGGRAAAALLASGCAAALLVVVTPRPAAAAPGDLSYQGCVENPGSGALCDTSNLGLGGANGIAMSADGRSVYVSGVSANTVSVLTRNPATGALTPAGCVINDQEFGTGSDPGCADHEGGMAQPWGVAVSPDGNDVYVAGNDDHAVSHYERDGVTGDLAGEGCIDDPVGPVVCGATQGGLLRARSVVVSPDGTAVYVGGGNTNEGAVTRLTRNPTTGVLSATGVTGCVMVTGGTAGCTLERDGFDDIYDIAMSSDGTSIYAVSRDSGVLFGFSTPSFGSLGCFYDTDSPPIAGCNAAQGVAAARGVAVSPDGKSVYVVSGANSAIVSFDRTPTGILSPAGCIGDAGTTACPTTQQGLGLGYDVAVSPDNGSVYVVSQDGGALVVLDRNTTTGALTPRGCMSQNAIGCGSELEGLMEPRGVVVSSDARSLYIASNGRDAVTRFDRAASSAVVPAPPPNAVSFRTKKTTCKGTCKQIKVRIETPPGVRGNAAVCVYVPDAKYCPGWKGGRWAARGAADRKTKYVKPVFVTVSGGLVTITLKTTGRGRARLAAKGVLKLKLQVDFQPEGGTRSSSVQKIKVKPKPKS